MRANLLNRVGSTKRQKQVLFVVSGITRLGRYRLGKKGTHSKCSVAKWLDSIRITGAVNNSQEAG